MKTIEIKKVASANEAIELINRLNYRNDTFVYCSTTHDDKAEYRHFDAYRDNGEKDSFAMIEIVVNGKLEIVRFFNFFRDIIVDFKLGDFNPDDYDNHFDQFIYADDQEETKKTIEIKTSAKNGAKIYYVNGKRVSREIALEAAAENREGNLFTIETGSFDEITKTVEYKATMRIADCPIKIQKKNLRHDISFDVIVSDVTVKSFYGHKDNAADIKEAKFNATVLANKIAHAYINGAYGIRLIGGCDIKILDAPTIGADVEDYAVSTEAQEVAIEAETKLASNNKETKAEVVEVKNDRITELKVKSKMLWKKFLASLQGYYVNFNGNFFSTDDAPDFTTFLNDKYDWLYRKDENGEYVKASEEEFDKINRIEIEHECVIRAINEEIARNTIKFVVGKWYTENQVYDNGEEPCKYLILKRTKSYVTIYDYQSDDWNVLEDYNANDEIDGEFDCIFRKKIQFDERGEYVDWEDEDGELVQVFAKNETEPPTGGDDDNDNNDDNDEDNEETDNSEDNEEVKVDELSEELIDEYIISEEAQTEAINAELIKGERKPCKPFTVEEEAEILTDMIEDFKAQREATTDEPKLTNNNTTTALVPAEFYTKHHEIKLDTENDFDTKLAELKADCNKKAAERDTALAALEQATTIFNDADQKWADAAAAVNNLCRDKARQLTAALNTITSNAGINIQFRDGNYRPLTYWELWIDFGTDTFKVCADKKAGIITNIIAYYDNPAQVETAINQLKAAIERGDKEFVFPTIEQLNTPSNTTDNNHNAPNIDTNDKHRDSLARAMKFALEMIQKYCNDKNLADAQYEMELYNICSNAMRDLSGTASDTCEQINDAAPADWKIFPAHDNQSFQVKFKNKTIFTLDSLILAKILPPDKFFEQFKPLVDDNFSPEQQFLVDRYHELENLQEMRLEAPPDTIKTIDEMIDKLKRDIADIVLNL